MNKKVIIELQDIVKSYDDEVIVNHLNLQIYENDLYKNKKSKYF